MSDPIGRWLIVEIALVLAAFYHSLFSTAFAEASESKLRAAAEEGDKRAARALPLVEEPKRFVAAMQAGTVCFGFFAVYNGMWLQGTGGITYNARIGDVCTGWVADHLEPGVTTRNPDENKNNGYVGLACIGNEAAVVSGDAKGARGFVTGKHGGCEHLMCWFDADALEKMQIDDKILVKAT